MALERALLDILVCPIDKRALLYFADDAVLYNPRLRRLYRIEDGVPLLLPRLAVPVADEEHGRLMTCARRGVLTAVTGGDPAGEPVDDQAGLVDDRDRAR